MTAFAAIYTEKPLWEADVALIDKLTSKLRSQVDGLSSESLEGPNFRAAKMWLGHAKTHGFAKDEATGSWLTFVGNPTGGAESSADATDYCRKILRGYIDNGQSAITSLNAPFVAILYDGREECLNIVTDRVGIQHIYMARLGQRHIISTSSLALAATIPVHLDTESLVDFFLSGNLMKQETFFKEIRKVGGATWTTIAHGSVLESGYWSAPEEDCGGYSLAEASAALTDRMGESVGARLSGDGRTSVELTGGLDSRFNLACAMASGKPFHAWTIGERGSPEVRITELLREEAPFEHHIISPAKDIESLFLEDLREINRLTDGETNALSLIASPSSNRQTKGIRDASISGLGGEILRGFYYISHKGVRNHSKNVRLGRLIGLKVTPNIGARPELFSEIFPAGYREVLRESVGSYFAGTTGKGLYWRLDDFYLRAREERFAGRSCTLNNFYYRCELPFFDNEIVDMSFRLPWKFKSNSRIVKSGLAWCHPGYAGVPLVSGLPARPLNAGDWPLLMMHYYKFAKKAVKKAKQMLFRKSLLSADDTGMSGLIARKLRSAEMASLLEPDNMASSFLYDSDRFREFTKENGRNGFQDRVQIGLIISFELTCRYIGSTLRVN